MTAIGRMTAIGYWPATGCNMYAAWCHCANDLFPCSLFCHVQHFPFLNLLHPSGPEFNPVSAGADEPPRHCRGVGLEPFSQKSKDRAAMIFVHWPSILPEFAKEARADIVIGFKAAITQYSLELSPPYLEAMPFAYQHKEVEEVNITVEITTRFSWFFRDYERKCVTELYVPSQETGTWNKQTNKQTNKQPKQLTLPPLGRKGPLSRTKKNYLTVEILFFWADELQSLCFYRQNVQHWRILVIFLKKKKLPAGACSRTL